MKYAFVRYHRAEFRISSMCRVLRIHRSGYYAWLRNPKSARSQEDERLLKKIHHFYEESDRTYGSPRIHGDLLEDGETCGVNRVARIMRQNGMRAMVGLKMRRYRYGRPAVGADNHLVQNFIASRPDEAWTTDISYIRTMEGWLYLAVVMGLYSRRIIGWSMQNSLHRDLVVQALLMAVWKRRPRSEVIIHSDQGAQYGSDDWIRFCKIHGLRRSMSRRGNCYDNDAMESFFGSLKKERIRRRTYRTRADARSDVFEYIEVFYNRRRRHEYLGWKSPVEFEKGAIAS